MSLTRRQAEEAAYRDARDFSHLPTRVLDALMSYDATLPEYSHDFSDLGDWAEKSLPLEMGVMRHRGQ